MRDYSEFETVELIDLLELKAKRAEHYRHLKDDEEDEKLRVFFMDKHLKAKVEVVEIKAELYFRIS